MKKKYFLILAVTALLEISCSKDKNDYTDVEKYPAIKAAFGAQINPDNPANYTNQPIPAYINRDNTNENPISDAGATLGRVLFYDKKLSSNNTVSCASCHQQEHAFSDNAVASIGVNGLTARHTMRLVNARFGFETHFFWDERAQTLEAQTTQPIQNHAEMGYSGTNGDEGLTALLAKLQAVGYYRELFEWVYGDSQVTENKMQLALAQFVRSITSFDSKYDAGRALAANNIAPFSNFTDEENLGKQLFTQLAQFDATGNRIGGGVGCAGCHSGPEFDINPDAKNNGITGSLVGIEEFDNTRAPSLHDLVKANGTLNGPLMHTGEFNTLDAVIEHYNSGIVSNRNLDPRLKPSGHPQQLNMTPAEKSALKAFLLTLGGQAVYTDSKWSDPY